MTVHSDQATLLVLDVKIMGQCSCEWELTNNNKLSVSSLQLAIAWSSIAGRNGCRLWGRL
jgi:hypothetical protein